MLVQHCSTIAAEYHLQDVLPSSHPLTSQSCWGAQAGRQQRRGQWELQSLGTPWQRWGQRPCPPGHQQCSQRTLQTMHARTEHTWVQYGITFRSIFQLVPLPCSTWQVMGPAHLVAGHLGDGYAAMAGVESKQVGGRPLKKCLSPPSHSQKVNFKNAKINAKEWAGGSREPGEKGL